MEIFERYLRHTSEIEHTYSSKHFDRNIPKSQKNNTILSNIAKESNLESNNENEAYE